MEHDDKNFDGDAFQDGWGDDDDLDLDVTLHEETAAASADDVTAAVPVAPPLSQSSSKAAAAANESSFAPPAVANATTTFASAALSRSTPIPKSPQVPDAAVNADGWDDDQDLVFDESETADIETTATPAAAAGAPVAPFQQELLPSEDDPISTSAWGEDDDDLLFLDDTDAASVPKEDNEDDDDDDTNNNSNILQPQPPVVAGNTGWDQDDDDLFFDESQEAEAVAETIPKASAAPLPPLIVSKVTIPPPKLPVRAPPPTTAVVPVPVAAIAKEPIPNAGWGDDDDDLFFDEESDTDAVSTQQQSVPVPFHHRQAVEPPAPVIPTSDNFDDANGWDDDTDIVFDDVDTQLTQRSSVKPPPPPPPRPPPPAQQSRQSLLYAALQEYLLQLPRLESSINAVLDYECNTVDKAMELVQYYTERPGLTQYTLEKELPRMEYALVNGTSVVPDKSVVARFMQQDSSLMSRCSNQSLLADMLQVFTGSDLLVRPQFMACAMAQSCRFLLDPRQTTVQCNAQLDLTLPTEHGRWKVAKLLVHISFCPHPSHPVVEYRLESIQPIAQPSDADWTRQLQSVADMLEQLHPEEDDAMMHPFSEDSNTFRDVFLEQSQSLLQNSAVGMKSAWQEIDTVAGFSSKFGRLPRFNDMMEAAEAAQPMSPVKQRPTSILGGFLGKLAKSVALPDEDPSMYEAWQAPPAATAHIEPPHFYQRSPAPEAAPPALYNKQTPKQVAPRLYSKETPTPVTPRLYNKETPPLEQDKTNTEAVMPRLYNEETPPPAAHPPVQVPRLYRQSPATPQPPSRAAQPPIRSHGAPRPPPQSLPPLPASQSFESSVENGGWDDELDLDEVDDDVLSYKAHTPDQRQQQHHQQALRIQSSASLRSPSSPPTIHVTASLDQSNWIYNPADDIIPTRKRWKNPKPGSRQLRSFATPVK